MRKIKNCTITCLCLIQSIAWANKSVADEASGYQFIVPSHKIGASNTDQARNNLLLDITQPYVTNRNFQPVANTTDTDSSFRLKDLVRVSIQNDSYLKMTVAMIEQENAKIGIAKAEYYPSLNASINSKVDSATYAGEERSNNRRASLNGNYKIFDFGKRKANLQLALVDKTKQIQQHGKAKEDLAYEVSKTFIEVLRYSKLLETLKKEIDGYSKITNLVKERTILGASNQAEYEQARIKLLSAQVSKANFEVNQQKWLEKLKSLTHLHLKLNSLSNDLTNIGNVSCAEVNLAENKSANIKFALSEIESSKAKIRAAKADSYPSLDLVYDYSYKLQKLKTTGGLFEPLRKERRGSYSFGLEVSMPLYNGGKIQANKQLALAEYITNLANLEHQKRKAQENTDFARVQIPINIKAIEVLKQQQQVAVKTRDLYQMQYFDLGTRTLLDLLSAEESIHSSGKELVNIRFNNRNLALDCLYESGNLLANVLK